MGDRQKTKFQEFCDWTTTALMTLSEMKHASSFKIFISRLFPCTVVCITVVLPITRDWEVMQSELTITLVAPLAIGPYVM